MMVPFDAQFAWIALDSLISLWKVDLGCVICLMYRIFVITVTETRPMSTEGWADLRVGQVCNVSFTQTHIQIYFEVYTLARTVRYSWTNSCAVTRDRCQDRPTASIIAAWQRQPLVPDTFDTHRYAFASHMSPQSVQQNGDSLADLIQL